MIDYSLLESVAIELMGLFDIHAPPVPVEAMLQNPLPDMWDEVDISLVSGSFMTIGEPYLPRMSLARVLARHIAGSEWGTDRGLTRYVHDSAAIGVFARIIVMPRAMIALLSPQARIPLTMSDHFEAPLKEVEQRLQEMALI